MLMFAGATASAQDPVRLPGMVITGEAGPGALRGMVRDDLKYPVEGAEVLIPSLKRRAYTRGDGTYRFDSLPRGKHEVWARKLGYRVHAQRITIGSDGATVDFEIKRAPRALPAIVSSAERGGLSGVVADTTFKVMEGVLIRVSGEGRTAYTDSSGGFFFPLKSGSYLVSISRDGYAPRVVSVTIPDDSGRRIQAFLQPTSTRMSKWVMIDLSRRMAWRSQSTSRVFTREQLQKLKIEWLLDAARMMTAHFGMREQPSGKCEAIIDARYVTSLDALTIDFIDSVEFYTTGGPCPLTIVWMR